MFTLGRIDDPIRVRVPVFRTSSLRLPNLLQNPIGGLRRFSSGFGLHPVPVLFHFVKSYLNSIWVWVPLGSVKIPPDELHAPNESHQVNRRPNLESKPPVLGGFVVPNPYKIKGITGCSLTKG